MVKVVSRVSKRYKAIMMIVLAFVLSSPSILSTSQVSSMLLPHVYATGVPENSPSIPAVSAKTIQEVATPDECPSGDSSCNPYFLVYDSSDNLIYVANDDDFDSSGTIGVINGTAALITQILVGAYPQYLAYDPNDNRIFAPVSSTSSVYVINGKTSSVVKTIKGLPGGAYFPLYDPENNEVYVTDTSLVEGNLQGGGVVSAINDATYKVTNIDLPCKTDSICGASFILYDPLNKNVYVSVPFSSIGSLLYEISSQTNTVIATIQLNNGGLCSAGMETDGYLVYNSANKDIFVQCFEGGTSGTGEVLVINSKNVETNIIPVGSEPYFLTNDPSNGAIYVNSFSTVSGQTGNTVYVINKHLTATPILEENSRGGCCVSGPGGFLVYSPTNKDVFVIGSTTEGILNVLSSGSKPKIVTTLATPTGSMDQSGFGMYNPVNGYTYITVGQEISIWS